MSQLSIMGFGVELPPARRVRDLVVAAGGSIDGYAGWDHIGVAEPDVHPGDMASSALAAALADAAMEIGELRLVISVGVSRDYPPSWSVATETLKRLGAPPTTLGFDLTIGCLGALVALNLIPGWLAGTGGAAAIVAAERWSQTVDRRNKESRALWGHADGASALIVRAGDARGSRARFEGAVFHSHPDWNDLVLVKHGGTRFPTPPHGIAVQREVRTDVTPRDIFERYQTNYQAAFAAFRERFAVTPTRLVCSQISPKMVDMIANVAAVPLARTSQLGHSTGHVGSSDLVLGLRDVLARGQLDGPVALAASTPYACGFGLVTPP